MRKLAIFVAALGFGLVVLAGVLALREFAPPLESVSPVLVDRFFATKLDPAAVEAEIARLNALPGETPPADLITEARAVTGCIEKRLPNKPAAAAVEASQRLSVLLFAVQKGERSPLIDRRLVELADHRIGGPEELVSLIEAGTVSQAEVEGWWEAFQAYLDLAHPIYTGIDLADNAAVENDFLAMLRTRMGNQQEVKRCYRARVAQ